MITFLQVSLYLFAGCAALGLIPPAVLTALAGGERRPGPAVLALLIAAFVVFVLFSSAVML